MVAETETSSVERGAQIDLTDDGREARENVWVVLATLRGECWAEPNKTRLREA
jgi:hypothetical protein